MAIINRTVRTSRVEISTKRKNCTKNCRDDTDKAILTEYINKIIREAIDHGGDSGGPYFCNGEELHAAMRRLKMWLSLKDYVICGGKKDYMYYAKPISEEEE